MKDSERGNVLFYILIAVALIGALSFAVSQGTRGNLGQVNAEKARLLATEIIEYGNVMASGVAQLRLRGTDVTELCFDHDSWGADNYDYAACNDNLNRVYHVKGAGLIWARPPAEAMDSAAGPDNLWHIYGDNEIDQAGTTCAAAGCAELLLIADELSKSVCTAINNLLDVNNPGGNPPTDTDIGETRYTGSFAYTATIGDEAGGADLQGKSAACFQRTSNGEYVFYKVLLAR